MSDSEEYFLNLVQDWRDGDQLWPLWEDFSMTREQYAVWVKHPDWFKLQHGVQVVWTDPVEAGAVQPGEDYVPRWSFFDDPDDADRFARGYESTVGEKLQYANVRPYDGDDKDDLWMAHGVREVNRATRWAVEAYGEWRIG